MAAIAVPVNKRSFVKVACVTNLATPVALLRNAEITDAAVAAVHVPQAKPAMPGSALAARAARGCSVASRIVVKNKNAFRVARPTARKRPKKNGRQCAFASKRNAGRAPVVVVDQGVSKKRLPVPARNCGKNVANAHRRVTAKNVVPTVVMAPAVSARAI